MTPMTTSQDTAVLRYTDEAFSNLQDIAELQPEMWRNPATDFQALLAQRGISKPTEHTGLTAISALTIPLPEASKNRRATDRYALKFMDNIPGITRRHAADPNLLAWLSCNPLLELGIKRWPFAAQTIPQNWVNQHFLPEAARDITNYSVAGRLLWMAILCKTVSLESPSTSAQDLNDHLSENAEQYHQWKTFQVMRSPKVATEYFNALTRHGLGINIKGSYELARDINRMAGARLLANLDKTLLRERAEATTKNLMTQPRFVADRSKIDTPPAITVLSLGAGAQTTVMALMCETGHAGFTKPDIAIFADTGWEPPSVYENLNWLRQQLSFDIIEVSAGDIRQDILDGKVPSGHNFISIPVFTRSKDGKEGRAKRQCTSNYKINPILQEIRKRLGIDKGKRAPAGVYAEVWLGITTEEASRQKPSKEEYINNRHPFIEKGMSRAQLMEWFQRHYPERNLPRSACIGCPYRTDTEWKHLRDTEPQAFDDAIFVDMALRQSPKLKNNKVDMYLSRHRVPLHALNLENQTSQTDLMQEECAGICRV